MQQGLDVYIGEKVNQNNEFVSDGPLAHQENHESSVTPKVPSFKGIRLLNWCLAALMICGFALQLFAVSSGTGAALLGVTGIMFLAPPVISALALGGKDMFVMGLYIFIDETRQRRLINLAFFLNWILLGFGVVGVFASFATSQIGVIPGLFLFLILPAINIRALRNLKLLLRRT